MGDGGYSAPLDFSTVPNGCEKSALLETSQFQKPIAVFELLRLNHLRRFSSQYLIKIKEHQPNGRCSLIWWEMVDSNHRRRSQQIYSLSPLATREISHIKFCWSWWTDAAFLQKSAVLTAKPFRTSRLKISHCDIFLTPLTLSGFKSD